MFRTVHQHIFLGVLLTMCGILFCTDAAQAETKTVAGSKQTTRHLVIYPVPAPYYYVPPTAPRIVIPPIPPMPPVRPYVWRANMNAPRQAPPVAAPSILQPTMKEQPQEGNVHDELDAFYARLAKIQLEKHQLAEALNLVQKIRSEIFKVRTVVSLAEFVSRDGNYRNEADQLYRLALAGLEALDKNQPFRIDTNAP
jgi:uncharacterized protein (UPF0335 family)